MKNCRVTTIKGIDNDEYNPIFNGFELELEPGDFSFYVGVHNGTRVKWDTQEQVAYGSVVISSPYTLTDENLQNGEHFHGTLTKKTKFIFENCLYENTVLIRKVASLSTISINALYLKSMIDYGTIHTISMERSIMFTGDLSLTLDELTRLDLKNFFIGVDSNLSISGNIEVLKNQVNLTSLGLRNRAYVGGKVEDLVSGMCNYVSTDTPNGKIQGSLQMDLRGTNCTFFGSTSVQFNVAFSSTGATVKDSNNNPLKIYTKSNNQWSDPE